MEQTERLRVSEHCGWGTCKDAHGDRHFSRTCCGADDIDNRRL